MCGEESIIAGFRMPLAAGTKLGPYEILAPIGAGGMGTVYRATDTTTGARGGGQDRGRTL